MRNTIASTLVAVFFTIGLVGCKSAPKLAFWKAGDKTAAVGEEAVLANSAPALPADIARQAESLAASSPAIDMGAPASSVNAPAGSGGLAAPYTPAVNVASTNALGSGAKPAPTAYPTTGASPYPTTAAPVMAAVAPTQRPATQNSIASSAPHADSLGSVGLPYNPSAVPPARTVAAAPVTPSVPADRYGSSSLASTAPAYTPVVPSKPSGGDRYGNVAAAPETTSVPVTSSVPPAVTSTSSVDVAAASSSAPAVSKPDSVYGTPAAAGMNGGRYASTTPVESTPSQPVITPTPTREASPVAAPSVASAPAVSSAPAIASAPNYRPGGTGSYQGATPSLPTAEIATRPKPYKTEAAPSTRYEPVATPRYR